VGRVKKSGEMTGTRSKQPAKAARPARRSSMAKSAPIDKAARKTRRPAARGGGSRGKMTKGRRTPPTRRPAPEPEISYRVRALDPQEKCGPDTSVQQLFRVDESADGALRAHLVFFDRHGWYCEHGRTCPAVAQARRMGEAHTRQNGRTQNGRMRA
jgi:hypothetical protein